MALTFDYATQGELYIASITHSTKSPGFSDKLCSCRLCFASMTMGNWCSSRPDARCRPAMAPYPGICLSRCWCRACLRNELLRERGQRVKAGERSINLGLQSFGEGIEVPGLKCWIVDSQSATSVGWNLERKWPEPALLGQERFVRPESRLSSCRQG